MTPPVPNQVVDPQILVDGEQLWQLTHDCFHGIGIPGDDAAAVADVLIDANLRAMESHGFQRVPIYMKRVLAGLAGGTQNLRVVDERGVFCRIDAANALGPAAALRAVDRCLSISSHHGVGVVAVCNSTHFGAAGYYARRAATAGQVGIVMSNAVKRMAPYGASQPFLGTNPLAIAVPLAGHPDFVLDMSSSVIAQGKITRARDLGEELPPGVALDPAGRPTTDPGEALAGSLLPVGGPKGSGLAMAISMLCVLLAGADCDDQMGSLYNDFDRPQNTGHIFLTIDVGVLGRRSEIPVLDQMMDRLLGLPGDRASSTLKYPGQDTAPAADIRRRAGLPLHRGELLRVAGVCRTAGLDDVAARAEALAA